MTDDELGDCPLCGRPMVDDGRSVDRHHLIPKSKDGKEAELCHVVCHRKIHSVLSENELRDYWHTWARLKDHESIRKFIKWVRKKPGDYVDSHKISKTHRKRRR